MDRKTTKSKRSVKRKLDGEFEEHRKRVSKRSSDDNTSPKRSEPVRVTWEELEMDIRSHVDALKDYNCSDLSAAKSASHSLSQIAKNEEIVDLIVQLGAVPVLVKRLQPLIVDSGPRPCELEVVKSCAFALGLLAIKPEYQQIILDAGALPLLVGLLNSFKSNGNLPAANAVVRRSADAITNLAHENPSIKKNVRIEGGIPPLVELLHFSDVKVQRAAAGALRTLAFKNDENKNEILECDALPTLLLMLHSEDTAIQYEAVGVIGNLVHSSPNIKKAVLLAGALQPIIALLSSKYSESQREAALLLGQFASADSDCKVHIVQRGAIPPLLDILESSDTQLKEMSAFALGRLAQETHNQAGIVHNGGIFPLLSLLDLKNGHLQHNAAFALFGLADNEDNIASLIKFGVFQKLQDGNFSFQQTKDCVGKTLKRLEEKINGPVLNHLIYLMRISDEAVQIRIALALAHLCAPSDRKKIFLDNNGLELLLGLFESGNLKLKRDSSVALYKLATKASSLIPFSSTPLSPAQQLYLGEQYMNNPVSSDVTFLVEGKQFYAHRTCLLASSDAFRAMFNGGYRERDVKDVKIPNIKWNVFELMMRYIYTGSVDVDIDTAPDLLRASDQYLLEGLKRLCEYTIAQGVSVDNVSLMYELSESFNAVSLREECILFLLENFDKLSSKPWCPHFVQRIMPEIQAYFTTVLLRHI